MSNLQYLFIDSLKAFELGFPMLTDAIFRVSSLVIGITLSFLIKVSAFL